MSESKALGRWKGRLSAAALVLSLGASQALAQAPVPTTIALPAQSLLFAPVYIAQEQGFFRDRGINAKIIYVAGPGVINAMLGKSADFTLISGGIQIAAAARSGKTRFDISLDPVDLGRIDVRINVDRNGQVTSHLTVEKPETLQMLRQDAPQLQRALDDAGLKTGSNGLSFSLRDQNSSGQNSGQNDNGGNARRLIISEDDTVAAAPVGRSYGRMLGSSSGVDIRV